GFMGMLSELELRRARLRIQSRKQALGATDFSELFRTGADAVVYQLVNLGIPAADMLKRPAGSFAFGYVRGLCWGLALAYIEIAKAKTLDPDCANHRESVANKLC